MKRVLAPGGVIATQGECLWLHLPLITTVLKACAEVFASVDYAFTTVPTYPSGQIGFILASNEQRGNMVICSCFFASMLYCKVVVSGLRRYTCHTLPQPLLLYYSGSLPLLRSWLCRINDFVVSIGSTGPAPLRPRAAYYVGMFTLTFALLARNSPVAHGGEATVRFHE